LMKVENGPPALVSDPTGKAFNFFVVIHYEFVINGLNCTEHVPFLLHLLKILSWLEVGFYELCFLCLLRWTSVFFLYSAEFMYKLIDSYMLTQFCIPRMDPTQSQSVFPCVCVCVCVRTRTHVTENQTLAHVYAMQVLYHWSTSPAQSIPFWSVDFFANICISVHKEYWS
jgi:hypothetical protein